MTMPREFDPACLLTKNSTVASVQAPRSSEFTVRTLLAVPSKEAQPFANVTPCDPWSALPLPLASASASPSSNFQYARTSMVPEERDCRNWLGERTPSVMRTSSILPLNGRAVPPREPT